MPRHNRSLSNSVSALLKSFADQITAVVHGHAVREAREIVLRAFGGSGAPPAVRGPGRPPGARKAKAVRKVSAKQHKAAKLQGAYMGSMRTLPKSDQAAVKAMRAKKGVVEAIALAKRLKVKAGAAA